MKKHYVKPELDIVELRPEEMLAKGNCRQVWVGRRVTNPRCGVIIWKKRS